LESWTRGDVWLVGSVLHSTSVIQYSTVEPSEPLCVNDGDENAPSEAEYLSKRTSYRVVWSSQNNKIKVRRASVRYGLPIHFKVF